MGNSFHRVLPSLFFSTIQVDTSFLSSPIHLLMTPAQFLELTKENNLVGLSKLATEQISLVSPMSRASDLWSCDGCSVVVFAVELFPCLFLNNWPFLFSFEREFVLVKRPDCVLSPRCFDAIVICFCLFFSFRPAEYLYLFVL